MRKRTTNPRKARRSGEEGYILLYLMFLVALVAFSLATVLPELKFERERDQEEEMVHRGVQYSRAVRRYFRKFGTYPMSIDALENSNDVRFLRKRYKDPITGKDFKVLNQTDVKFSFGNGIAGAQTLGQPIGGQANPAAQAATPDPNAANGGQTPAGTDPKANDPSQSNPSQSNPSQSNSGPSSTLPFTAISGQPVGNTYGGGGIVGVASRSTKETIRVYNKKNHYNEWQFVYDPSTDRGALIVGPYQPSMQSFVQGQNGLTGLPAGLGAGMGSGTNPSMPGSGLGASQNGIMQRH